MARPLYQYGEWPALLTAGTALLMMVTSYLLPRLHPHRIACCFIFLLYLLGPGLLVNVIFKDHWGRARPVQVTEFGGDQLFSQPWQKRDLTDNNSFPCGHASVAFYMFTPYFLLRYRNSGLAVAWLALGIGYGIIMGVARVAQGGHFISDVLWSGGMVYLTGSILAALMLPNNDRSKNQPFPKQRR